MVFSKSGPTSWIKCQLNLGTKCLPLFNIKTTPCWKVLGNTSINPRWLKETCFYKSRHMANGRPFVCQFSTNNFRISKTCPSVHKQTQICSFIDKQTLQFSLGNVRSIERNYFCVKAKVLLSNRDTQLIQPIHRIQCHRLQHGTPSTTMLHAPEIRMTAITPNSLKKGN